MLVRCALAGACKGAYSAFTQDGTLVLFEAGEEYRYAALMLAKLQADGPPD